jgi:transcription elongation factor Elf1
MITITGGVISRQNGSSVTYKPQCENCNNVEPVETTVTITRGVTEISTFNCSNCGTHQITRIKDVPEAKKVLPIVQ